MNMQVNEPTTPITNLDTASSTTPNTTTTTTIIATSTVTHKDTEFGFTFTMPINWKGYSVVKSSWEGYPLVEGTPKQSGTELRLRNPKWTQALPYEDIPVMVFTLAEWNSYQAKNFTVSAAPYLAGELGRNNVYVFALPPRWDFDNREGFKEAGDIVKSKPLKTFNIQTNTQNNNQNNVSGKLNIDVICQNSLSYMSFPDGASANKFITECKEGKHPEVIEKYKAGLNLPDGAVI